MDYLKIKDIPIVGVEKVLGSEHTIYGNSQRDLILRTRGKVKVQWGNKFVDLFSMGKLLGVDLDIFKQVQTFEEIDQSINSIVYVVEDNSLYLVYDGKIFSLVPSEGEYVSFRVTQLTNGTEKDTALRNLGLLFDTLDEFETAVEENNIGEGLAYIVETSELYSVVNGQSQNLFLNKRNGGTVYNTIFINTDIAIDTTGKIKLGNTLISEDTIEVLNTLNIKLNGVDRIQINPSESVFNGINRFPEKIITNSLESSNFTQGQSGFSLYQIGSKSHIEADYLSLRYPILTSEVENENVFSSIWINNYGTINYQLVNGNTIISLKEETSNSIPKYSVNDEVSVFTFEYIDDILTGIEISFKVLSIEIYDGTNESDGREAGIYYTLENLTSLEVGDLLHKKIFRIGSSNVNGRAALNIYDSNPDTSFSSPNIDLYENTQYISNVIPQNINTKIGNLKLSPILTEISLNSETVVAPKFKQYGLYSNNAHLRGGIIKGLDTEINLTYGGFKSSNVDISAGIIKSADQHSIILDLTNNSITIPKINNEIDFNLANEDVLSESEMISLTSLINLQMQLPIVILVQGVPYGFGSVSAFLTNNILEVAISIVPYDPDLFNRKGYQFRVNDYGTTDVSYVFIKQKTY